jgi:BON domain
MKNNAELQSDVLDELLWDPRINVANVEVAAQRGTVTLRGSTASCTDNTPSAMPVEVKNLIEKALVRKAEPYRDATTVAVSQNGQRSRPGPTLS